MRSPEFADDSGLVLSYLLTHENYLNFRILTGVSFDQVDYQVEVCYEY